MTENQVTSIIVNGSELDKIKTTYKGINPKMTIVLRNGEKIAYDLKNGYWGSRIPSVTDGVLTMPSPKDTNPSIVTTDTQITETYHQVEDLIPVEEIVKINFTYDRPVVKEITPAEEPTE
jgi:hypothetical protein